MDPNEQNLLRETHRLARENNEMLHRIRRGAFLSGLVKLVLYAIILLVPIWFYMTYLNGTVQNLLQDLNKLEGINTQAQNQFQSVGQVVEETWQNIESKFTGATTTSAQ